MFSFNVYAKVTTCSDFNATCLTSVICFSYNIHLYQPHTQHTGRGLFSRFNIILFFNTKNVFLVYFFLTTANHTAIRIYHCQLSYDYFLVKSSLKDTTAK